MPRRLRNHLKVPETRLRAVQGCEKQPVSMTLLQPKGRHDQKGTPASRGLSPCPASFPAKHPASHYHIPRPEHPHRAWRTLNHIQTVRWGRSKSRLSRISHRLPWMRMVRESWRENQALSPALTALLLCQTWEYNANVFPETAVSAKCLNAPHFYFSFLMSSHLSLTNPYQNS